MPCNWDSALEQLCHALYVVLREEESRELSPISAIIDGQSIKAASKAGPFSSLRVTTGQENHGQQETYPRRHAWLAPACSQTSPTTSPISDSGVAQASCRTRRHVRYGPTSGASWQMTCIRDHAQRSPRPTQAVGGSRSSSATSSVSSPWCLSDGLSQEPSLGSAATAV